MSAQEGLFPPFGRPASSDGMALLTLFYYFRRDHGALSLCMRHFRPLEKVLAATEDELKELFREHGHLRAYVASFQMSNPHQQMKAQEYADQQMRLLSKKAQGVLLLRTDPYFPQDLLRAQFPVDWVFCHPGPLPATLPAPKVAVVGSRRSTEPQLEVAKTVAQVVSGVGGTVITGLASGADIAAYEGVRGTRHSFVGVLGNGILNMYPPEHKPLVEELIRNGGYVVTEVPPTALGNATSFISRNRIIATLADAVVVVSGDYASGTAHTVRFGHEAGVSIISADPAMNSGITRLVHELGGKHVTVPDLPDAIRKLGK